MHPSYNDFLNNLHYFYSTAPQVLGAILALIAAVAAIRRRDYMNSLLANSRRMISTVNKKEYKEILNTYPTSELTDEILEEIVYAHMARSRKSLNHYVSKLKEKVEQEKNKISKQSRSENIESHQNERIDYIIKRCDNVIVRCNSIKYFQQNTALAFLVNILTIIILLIIFFYIPSIVLNMRLYYIFLGVGLIFTIFSLGYTFIYLKRSSVIEKIDKEYLNTKTKRIRGRFHGLFRKR